MDLMKKYLKIGQISDIHIGEDDSLVQGINVRKNFLHALNSEAMQDVDFLVLSGDLANINAEPGAYKFAVKNKVPVLPVFITMTDSDKLGPDGFYIQELTINIMEPLYPNSELTRSEQIQDLMARNAALWKECYEKTYNKRLKYITEE